MATKYNFVLACKKQQICGARIFLDYFSIVQKLLHEQHVSSLMQVEVTAKLQHFKYSEKGDFLLL